MPPPPAPIEEGPTVDPSIVLDPDTLQHTLKLQ